MSWWEWLILVIGTLAILIVLLFPLSTGSKITIIISFITATVTIYNLIVDIGIRSMEERNIVLGEDKAHWIDIHSMFMNHSSLSALYEDIYHPISDTPDEYAALSILAQSIEGMIEVHYIPKNIVWQDVLDTDWLLRIYYWISNDRFRTYWGRNKGLYKPYTNDTITKIWSLIPENMM